MACAWCRSAPSRAPASGRCSAPSAHGRWPHQARRGGDGRSGSWWRGMTATSTAPPAGPRSPARSPRAPSPCCSRPTRLYGGRRLTGFAARPVRPARPTRCSAGASSTPGQPRSPAQLAERHLLRELTLSGQKLNFPLSMKRRGATNVVGNWYGAGHVGRHHALWAFSLFRFNASRKSVEPRAPPPSANSFCTRASRIVTDGKRPSSPRGCRRIVDRLPGHRRRNAPGPDSVRVGMGVEASPTPGSPTGASRHPAACTAIRRRR